MLSSTHFSQRGGTGNSTNPTSAIYQIARGIFFGVGRPSLYGWKIGRPAVTFTLSDDDIHSYTKMIGISDSYQPFTVDYNTARSGNIDSQMKIGILSYISTI
jgi:hypothetical protein